MNDTKICRACRAEFTITGDDQEFYKKFDVPEPSNCPECRFTRRLMERNVKYLYYRTCDFTKKKTLSQYRQNQLFPVYSPEAWWSDNWDATDYGQEFDFNTPFFVQFAALKRRVPHLALFNTEGTMQNSDYNNCTAYMKNCYLVGESDYCEESYYSNLLKQCISVVDCSVCYECELCYECVDCMNCYGLRYSVDCQNCRDSFFLNNCVACSDCIGCINQRNKRYMIFNTQYSKEEYEQHKKNFGLDATDGVSKLRAQYADFFQTQPQKNLIAEHNQNSSGNHLFNSKNSFHCFDSKDLEDCRYCARLSLGVKSCMDYNSWGNKAELIYFSSGCGDNIYNLKFCVNCHKNVRDCTYCQECFSSSNLFGCIGMKHKQYCILNKQYTKEEYEDLVPRIVAQMSGKKDLRAHGASAQASEKSGKLQRVPHEAHAASASFERAELTNKEFGEFFPQALCAYAYNEALAMDVFPLSKEAALEKGYHWLEELPAEQNSNANACASCGKNFNIIPQELKFYEFLKIPAPANCQACRHKSRVLLRLPPKLWPRSCAKCGNQALTSYPPESEKMVYCEACYLALVY